MLQTNVWGAVAVGTCVCMCVAGLSLDKEGIGKRERKKGDFDESGDSCLPAAGRGVSG